MGCFYLHISLLCVQNTSSNSNESLPIVFHQNAMLSSNRCKFIFDIFAIELNRKFLRIKAGSKNLIKHKLKNETIGMEEVFLVLWGY